MLVNKKPKPVYRLIKTIGTSNTAGMRTITPRNKGFNEEYNGSAQLLKFSSFLSRPLRNSNMKIQSFSENVHEHMVNIFAFST